MPTTSGTRTYSLVTDPIPATSGTGLDQIVRSIFADPGLAGATDGKDIKSGAQAADQLNGLIIKAAAATGAASDGVFTVAEVTAMNAYLRGSFLGQWAALHGDDEDGSETGYHLVQNDGGNLKYRGDSLLDTVADGIYHMGFEIRDGHFLNEDGDPNASVERVAEWLTQFYTDHSTSGTGLDRITDLVMADAGLDARIPDREIAAGADAANGLNRMLAQALSSTGVAKDNWINVTDVARLNAYLRADPGRIAEWQRLHGDDERGSETGFHQVQNDGASTRFFGENLVDTVADGIYHLGFMIKDGRLLNEDGDPNATLSDVADWLNYFLVDASTTGTGLDRIVDLVKVDRGLARNTEAADINGGAQAADALNKIIASLIARSGAAVDGWITPEDVRQMNGLIRTDAALLKRWTELHGDDEEGTATGFHLVQNNGANTNFFGRNLVDTVADGIYHMGFEIRDGRFLNEDGDPNASVFDVATWLNFFHGTAVIVAGDGSANDIRGDARGEQINADGGDDTVAAGAGNDLVFGSWGNDLISGAEGNDLVYGGSGNDSLSGGAGNDLFRVAGSKECAFEGWDTYDGGAGQDRIVAYGDKVDIGLAAFGPANGIEVIDATGVKGGARLLGDWRDNLLDFSGASILGAPSSNTQSAAGPTIVIDGGGGKDTVIGSAGHDSIEGGAWGDQSLSGGAGNDTLHGGGGTDAVSGGAGDDLFRVTGNKDAGFEGWDSYSGGAGKDRIAAYGDNVDIGLAAFGPASGVEIIDATGATGNVRLVGDWKDNLLDFSATAFAGKLSIDGGGGKDTVIGGAGHDSIEGGAWGDQALSGGAGNDTLHGGGGTDAVSGGAGDDLFRVTGNKDAGFEGWDSYSGGAGKDRIAAYGDNVDIGLAAFGPASGVEIIDATGATGNVRLVGDWKDNLLDFSATAFAGKLSIDGGGGKDTVIGSAGHDSIEGGAWGDQALSGGAGNDTLHGGGGTDAVSGGAGDDLFRVTGNKDTGFEGWDSYSGGAGKDRIAAYGDNVDIGLAAFGPANGVEIIDATGATGNVRLVGDWKDNLLDFSATAFAGKLSIDGGGGKDTVIGGAGHDLISGGDYGDDRLDGGLGNDTLTGGSGRDVFVFGKNWGRDVVADFQDKTDRIDLHGSGAIDIKNLSISMSGTDTVIAFAGGEIVLTGFKMADLSAADLVF